MELREQVSMISREESGVILARKLARYTGTDAVVIGIPQSGLPVAVAIARQLALPLDVIPAQRVNHPGNNALNLGSVCLTEVVMPADTGGIPQDLVAHQIAILKARNANDNRYYHQKKPPISLAHRTVIVVDDMLHSSEVLAACIHEIRKQKPGKVVVAIPIVEAEAARVLIAEVDELHFIRMEHEIGTSKKYYSDTTRPSRQEIRRFVETGS